MVCVMTFEGGLAVYWRWWQEQSHAGYESHLAKVPSVGVLLRTSVTCTAVILAVFEMTSNPTP